MIDLAAAKRSVDRLGRVVLFEDRQPTLGSPGEELATRDAEPLRSTVDPAKRVVG